MADIAPFRAVHYDPSVVDLNSVLAPPYDVISPEERDALYASSPHNMIHLILGQGHVGSGVQDASLYAGAGQRWRQWRSSGALVRDAVSALYVYEQKFHLEGDEFARTGLVASVRLEPYDSGVVFPHEQTFAGPKADRLQLMEAVDANLDSVFALYRASGTDLPERLTGVKQREPLLTARTSDGQLHRVWAVYHQAEIDSLSAKFRDAPLVIADGHHRYETALAYRDRHASASSRDRVLMTLVSVDDPGLLVRPTHRTLPRSPDASASLPAGRPMADAMLLEFSNDFEIAESGSAGHTLTLLERLAADGKAAVGLYFGEDEGYVLQPRTPVNHLYEGAMQMTPDLMRRLPGTVGTPESDQIGYTHSGAEAVCQVNANDAWVAVLLQGIPAAEVFSAAVAGQLMPQKSTYFYPKLQSGLLMRALETPDE